MGDLRLVGLVVYPIKSLGGVVCERAFVEARGLRWDRRWMVVDAQDSFVTMREHPKMAQVQVTLDEHGIGLQAPQMPPCEVPFVAEGEMREVRVWRSICEAVVVGGEVGSWLSTFMGFSCRLVQMPETTKREVDASYRAGEGIVSFADAYPCLLTSEASLAELNARLDAPVPMSRFRPNLIVEGCGAFAEDGWQKVWVGEVPFAVVKPCDRCSATTVDGQTGTKGTEPLRTLAGFRKGEDGKVYFGQNLIPLQEGAIAVGAPIRVEARASSVPLLR